MEKNVESIKKISYQALVDAIMSGMTPDDWYIIMKETGFVPIKILEEVYMSYAIQN